MEFDRIYKQLEIISNKEIKDIDDLSYLIETLKFDNAEIRAYIAELLVEFEGEQAKSALIKMCNDDDELVRVNACDSLSSFSSNDVYMKLIEVFKTDDSLLVKNYALLSIIDVMQNITVDKEKIQAMLYEISKNYEDQVKISAYKGLCILQAENCLDKLLKMLNNSSYEIRCNVINALFDVINTDNSTKIKTILTEHTKKEKSEAVLSVIHKFLSTT